MILLNIWSPNFSQSESRFWRSIGWDLDHGSWEGDSRVFKFESDSIGHVGDLARWKEIESHPMDQWDGSALEKKETVTLPTLSLSVPLASAVTIKTPGWIDSDKINKKRRPRRDGGRGRSPRTWEMSYPSAFGGLAPTTGSPLTE